MTREEFEMRLPDDARKPSDEEFEAIQTVYNYHPAFYNRIDPKSRIVKLYSIYGMRVIYDMRETAMRMYEIENEQKALRYRLDELKAEADKLAMI